MDELLGLNELKTLPLYKAIMAECLGTMILVFVGCGAGIGNNTLFAALTFGITLAAMISVCPIRVINLKIYTRSMN